MRINSFQCAGNLTRDPETSYTTSGAMLTKFTVAINPTSEAGETLFMDCTAWKQKADIAHKLLKKGMEVYLEGPLHLEKWTSRESGQERTKTAMTVFNIQIPRGQTQTAQTSSAAASTAPRQYAPPPPRAAEPPEEDPDSTDDLPF